MPRKASLANLSASDLHREVTRRKRSTGTLVKRRNRLLTKVARIETLIQNLGGTVATARFADLGGRKRPRNETTLPEALVKALKGKTMGVVEAAEAVQKAGYRTTAANFRTMVNVNLTNGKLFKRVERGRYTAK